MQRSWQTLAPQSEGSKNDLKQRTSPECFAQRRFIRIDGRCDSEFLKYLALHFVGEGAVRAAHHQVGWLGRNDLTQNFRGCQSCIADREKRLAGARSRDPCRPLLDFALVSGGASHRLLGPVRLSAEKARIRARHPGNVVVRSRQGGKAGTRMTHDPATRGKSVFD